VCNFYIHNLQFQARGTPHVHSLLAVEHDGITAEDVTSENPYIQWLVRELVRKTITCNLQYSDDTSVSADERDYFWRPEYLVTGRTEEDYGNDVRRLMFSPTMDFRLDSNNNFVCPITKQQYFQFQCANQMHKCMHTCWKHNYFDEKSCRFHYPVNEDISSESEAMLYTVCDKKKRLHTKVNPPRNNGWLNPLPTHPLLVFANHGNMDIQYISNVNGAVEYTCGYISKNEEPDEQMLINLFAKKLAQAIARSETGDIRQREKLRAAGMAFVSSQQVGTVQCVYTLLKLPFVQLSRTVITVSPVPTAQLTKNIITDMEELQQMDPTDSAVSTSVQSHAGRRFAYHLLCQQQYAQFGSCEVSLHTILSTFAISKPQRIKRDGSPAATVEAKFLSTDKDGKYV